LSHACRARVGKRATTARPGPRRPRAVEVPAGAASTVAGRWPASVRGHALGAGPNRRRCRVSRSTLEHPSRWHFLDRSRGGDARTRAPDCSRPGSTASAAAATGSSRLSLTEVPDPLERLGGAPASRARVSLLGPTPLPGVDVELSAHQRLGGRVTPAWPATPRGRPAPAGLLGVRPALFRARVGHAGRPAPALPCSSIVSVVHQGAGRSLVLPRLWARGARIARRIARVGQARAGRAFRAAERLAGTCVPARLDPVSSRPGSFCCEARATPGGTAVTLQPGQARRISAAIRSSGGVTSGRGPPAGAARGEPGERLLQRLPCLPVGQVELARCFPPPPRCLG